VRALDDDRDGDAPEAAERHDFEALYAKLRDGVLKGELAPGSLVSQVQLARQYNISRSPLREALRMLQYEGLVEAERGRRNRIALVSAPDLEELYALRIVVEALAVRLTVPRASDEDLRQLRERLQEMDDLGALRDFERWEVPHRAFHRGLVAGGGARLVATINELSDHAERYRRIFLSRPLAWSSVAADHAAIVEAFEARDAQRAASRLASHLATTALTVCAALAPDHDPAAVRESLRVVTQPGGGA
jgi:DNA-binding GntR family transcriptional regulator